MHMLDVYVLPGPACFVQVCYNTCVYIYMYAQKLRLYAWRPRVERYEVLVMVQDS